MLKRLLLLLTCLAVTGLRADDAFSLTIRSVPENAEVAINRQNAGRTPVTVTNLTAGADALITLKAPGYKTAYQTVNPQAGERNVVSVPLEPVIGLLLFRTKPVSAEVRIGDVAYGNTPLILNTLPQGTHEIRLAAQGFLPKDLKVVVTDATPQIFEETLISDSGLIHVSSIPSGAEVRVNGFLRGRTPCTVDRIERGQAKIDITLPGYHPYTEELRINAGDEHRLNAELRPQEGSLRVVSIPTKARIYLDNDFKGETDLDLGALLPGTYRLRVELPSHRALARTVTVESGKNHVEEFRLQSSVGTLSVITQPPFTTIFLDGKKLGTTRSSTQPNVSQQLVFTNITEGEHELTATARGYEELKQTITVTQGKILPLNLELKKMFIPDYWIETPSGTLRGVFIQETDIGVELETKPGLRQTIPNRDIRRRGMIIENI